MENNHLREIANQLRQPTGEKGYEMGEMMAVTNAAMIQDCFQNIAFTNKRTIVEIGHGNGTHIDNWLQGNSSINYIGMEKSALMYAEAQSKNAKWVNTKRASFHLLDTFQLPIANDSVDAILTINTLYFWEEPQDMFQELARVLRTGGQLNITFADKSFMQRLPFTAELFKLYDRHLFEQLVRASPFYLHNIHQRYDTVVSNMGEPEERIFYTAVLHKK
jgi:SAM-dependent methyltransferase